ncbi:hypothetical protein N0V90_010469 [Kalmusia sp. IMI 367209]|nr:hypothetical protein N0V90_010469 [Kalmusia sp. IMI 367209]
MLDLRIHYLCQYVGVSLDEPVIPIPTGEEEHAEIARSYGKMIEQFEQAIQGSHKSLDQFEDDYRRQGLRYHKTRMAARCSPRLDAATLRNLKTVFTDFNTWIKPILEARELLKKALEECRPNGSPEALLERATNIEQIMLEFDKHYSPDQPTSLGEDHAQLLRDVDLLDTENTRMSEEGEIGANWWWPLSLFATFQPQGTEWQMFRQWVYTFPETKRCVQDNGMPFDRLASDMLYKYPEHYDGLEPFLSSDSSNYESSLSGSFETNPFS